MTDTLGNSGFPWTCWDTCYNSLCLLDGCIKLKNEGRTLFLNTSDMGRRRASDRGPMSVLRYGFPQHEGLRCDHPVCQNYATHRLLLQSTGPVLERETFACDDHAAQLQIGSKLIKDERLKKAGERNAPLAEIKK